MRPGVEPATPDQLRALDKEKLRRELRAQRRQRVPERDRDADAVAIASAASTILDTLSLPPAAQGAHPEYRGSTCVAIYQALPTEPSTHALAEMLHARGVTVIVPELLPDMDLDWHELWANGGEGPGLGRDAITDAMMILAPALAVDYTGTRLGQGGGSYDRALARRRSDALVVAVVNDEEYAAWPLPFADHDVRVHAVITPGAGLSAIPDAGC